MTAIPGTARKQRFRVGGDVLAERPDSIAIRLDASPVAENRRAVTVMLRRDVAPADAAAELRLLADELEGQA